MCVLAFLGILGYITWNSVERRSVMASTADIQVNAKRGRTTQELHREALPERQRGRGRGGFRLETKQEVQVTGLFSLSFSLSSVHASVRSKADWHAAVAFIYAICTRSCANRVVRDGV